MPDTIDTLYNLAEQQAGYFTASQAAAEGVPRQLLAYHRDAGNLERVAHGIYRLVRFPAGRFEDLVVACLWVGDDAVASHESALAVYELSDAMPAANHVTVSRRFRGRRAGVRVHRAALDDAERTSYNGVPVTTVDRTLVDIAVSSDASLVVDAAGEAIARGLITRRRLARAIADEPAACRVLRSLLESR